MRESGEMYLETMLILGKENDTVRRAVTSEANSKMVNVLVGVAYFLSADKHIINVEAYLRACRAGVLYFHTYVVPSPVIENVTLHTGTKRVLSDRLIAFA